jgi:hypothetical protein
MFDEVKSLTETQRLIFQTSSQFQKTSGEKQHFATLRKDELNDAGRPTTDHTATAAATPRRYYHVLVQQRLLPIDESPAAKGYP